MVQDGQAVAHLAEFRQDVGGDQHGLAHFPQGAQDGFHVRPGPGVHAGGRLVQDQEGGIVNEAAGQAEALLHAPGEGVHIGFALLRQLHQVQQALRHLFPVRRALAVAAAVEIQVFPAFQVVVDAEEVRHVADVPAGFGRVFHHVGAVHRGGAGGGFQEGGQDAHGGGFAGAVGADEAVEAAVADFQAQAVQGCEVAVALRQVIQD